MIQQSPSRPEVAINIEKRVMPGWKRGMDVCGVLIIGPLIAPLLIVVAVYIKLVSRGPILFLQKRVGYGGDDFLIYKFRTMHVPNVSRDEAHRDYLNGQTGDVAPNKKPDYVSDLIFGGKVLRKLSIDELPQLLNVLRGTMSLVGPRPDLLRLEDYEALQTRRFEVLPGMTGLWQVSGKNRLTFDEMVKLDIRYVETRTFGKDLGIIAKTFVVLLFELNE